MSRTQRVGMVFARGGLGRGGYYNEMGLKGLQQAHSDLGVSYDYHLIYSTSDIEPRLREFVHSERYALVTVMGFDASSVLDKVAVEYPHQFFAAFDAFADQPNVANYAGDPRSISFLTGAIATWLSQTQRIGALFGTECKGYWTWVSSYMAGAKYVQPDAEVLWEFLPSWSPDSEMGEAAAHRLYNEGVEVIMAHLDLGDRGVFSASKTHNKFVIGFNNERYLDTEHILFDVNRHLEVLVYDAIKRMVEGTLSRGFWRWGMEKGQFLLSYGDSPHARFTDEINRQAVALRKELIDGNLGELPETPSEVKQFLQRIEDTAGA
jgi:basic membrane protein A